MERLTFAWRPLDGTGYFKKATVQPVGLAAVGDSVPDRIRRGGFRALSCRIQASNPPCAVTPPMASFAPIPGPAGGLASFARILRPVGGLASFAPFPRLAGGSVASFVAFSPGPRTARAAILAGLGSFVTSHAPANCHSGSIGFVRAAFHAVDSPPAGRSARDGQCVTQCYYVYNGLPARVCQQIAHARISAARRRGNPSPLVSSSMHQRVQCHPRHDRPTDSVVRIAKELHS
jgi:hypothetical protein